MSWGVRLGLASLCSLLAALAWCLWAVVMLEDISFLLSRGSRELREEKGRCGICGRTVIHSSCFMPAFILHRCVFNTLEFPDQKLSVKGNSSNSPAEAGRAV